LTITKSLSWLIRATTDVETNVVAVERLKEFEELKGSILQNSISA
jgi:hypothetical protein